MIFDYNPQRVKNKALQLMGENKMFFSQIRKRKPKNLDQVVHLIHDAVFEEIDCLSCGNCCRSLGPRITDRDIERLSGFLKIKDSEVVEKYLRVDEDDDYVFKSMPCPFLGMDNYCFVYENRPKACREYPHTDRKKFIQLLNLTLENSKTCPAVIEIIDRMKEQSH